MRLHWALFSSNTASLSVGSFGMLKKVLSAVSSSGSGQSGSSHMASGSTTGDKLVSLQTQQLSPTVLPPAAATHSKTGISSVQRLWLCSKASVHSGCCRKLGTRVRSRRKDQHSPTRNAVFSELCIFDGWRDGCVPGWARSDDSVVDGEWDGTISIQDGSNANEEFSLVCIEFGKVNQDLTGAGFGAEVDLSVICVTTKVRVAVPNENESALYAPVLIMWL